MNNLDDVLTFAAVAELASFSAAARRLGLARSTVSQRVSRLERALGVRLLQRTTRQVRVTEAGAEYAAQVSAAVERIEAASASLADQTLAPTGTLRVTAPVEFGLRMTAFQDAVAEFSLANPAVNVEIHLLDRRVNLVEEGYDLALRIGPLDDSAWIARALGPPGTLHLYASPAYLAAHPAPTHPSALAEHAILAMRAHGLRWDFSDAGQAWRMTVQPRVLANSFGLLMELAARGVGIARAPDFIAEPWVQSGRLVRLLEAHAPPPVRWFAVYPSARFLAARTRAFLDALDHAFGPS